MSRIAIALVIFCFHVDTSIAAPVIESPALPGLTDRRYMLVSTISESILRFDAITGQFLDEFIGSSPRILSHMAVGGDGNLYVSSPPSNQVLRFSGSTGEFFGNFVKDTAQLPLGINFGPDGDLYVASRDANGILRFDGLTGDFKGLFATASRLDLHFPYDLLFRPNGTILLSSFERHRVVQFNATTGAYEGVFASAQNVPGISRAAGIALGPNGDLYMADYYQNIVRFDGNSGELIAIFASLPNDTVTDVGFGPDGHMYATLENRGAVVKIHGQSGAILGEITMAGPWAGSRAILFTVPEPSAGWLLLACAIATGYFRRAC